MTAPVEVWVEFASTYSYPAAMTVERDAAARGVALAWRPFLLGPVFAAQGWTDSPFNLQPAKGRYMWRGLERICDGLGLPFRRPPGFPQHTVTAARLALVGLSHGWGAAFIRAAFAAEFGEGGDLSDEALIARLVAECGADPDAALAEARSAPVTAALRAQTDRAMALGLFGAPSFTVDGELYWGHDRMAAALDHAAKGPP